MMKKIRGINFHELISSTKFAKIKCMRKFHVLQYDCLGKKKFHEKNTVSFFATHI